MKIKAKDIFVHELRESMGATQEHAISLKSKEHARC